MLEFTERIYNFYVYFLTNKNSNPNLEFLNHLFRNGIKKKI